jgi:DNA-binding NarL/FixJ family response regulator
MLRASLTNGLMAHLGASVTIAEERVLLGLQRGLSNRAIAAELILSRRTVESHISHLLAKTGCKNRTQLLLWVMGER